jgi:ABC-2 type transport system permease protein
LIEKEFKQIRRNPFLPKFIVAFPFIALAILPLAANFEISNVRLSVIDNSHSSYSERLVDKISFSGYFRISDISSDYRSSLRSVEMDKADIILEIPPRFEEDLIRDKVANVMISANTVNATKGGIGSAYLSRIITDYNNEIRAELMPASVVPANSGFGITSLYRFNPLLKYPIYMIPALMVMLLTVICGFLPAFNIVLEKEKGTLEQMNVTPVNKFTLILSKLIPYWIIGFVVLTICFGVARVFYGLVPAGSLFTIYLFASVFILALSGFGLVISNYANTIQQAAFMIFFFVLTFIFMSGLYTPVNNMPKWGQVISDFSPLKYLMQVMRLVYLKGSTTVDLLSQLIALVGFAIFFNGWAILSYKKH